MRYLFLTLALALSSYGGAGAHLLTRTRAAADTTSFITTWSITDNGTAAQRTITLPTTGTGYGVANALSIDWGDGNIDTAQTDSDLPFTHEYASGSGTTTPTITIAGTFPRWRFNNGGDKLKITGVTQWGSVDTISALSAFYGCSNLVSIAAGAWSATSWQNGFLSAGLTSLPDGCFADNSSCTSAEAIFGITGITTTPDNLFSTFTSCLTFRFAFSSCTSLATVSATTFANCGAVVSMDSTFDTCTALTTVPGALFSDCPLIKGSISGGGFYHTFENSGTVTIPAGLYDAQTIVQSFVGTYTGCSDLVAVPADLFKLNVDCISLLVCFEGCTSLTIVNSGALEFIVLNVDYSRAFNGCTSLVDFKSKIAANAATTFASFLDDSTINSTDYNAIMTDLEAQRVGAGIQPNVTFDGGTSIATGQGATDRASIASNETWTFQDSTP